MEKYENIEQSLSDLLLDADVKKRIDLFKLMAKQIFPALSNSALMINSKVELLRHD